MTGSEIAASESVNKGLGIIKSLLGAKQTAEHSAALYELHGIIFSYLQQATSMEIEKKALLADKENLEKENARLQTWSEDKEHYELIEPAPGAFAYRRMANVKPGEPFPWLCAKCYDATEKDILQIKHNSAGLDLYACSKGHEVRIHKKVTPTVINRPPPDWRA